MQRYGQGSLCMCVVLRGSTSVGTSRQRQDGRAGRAGRAGGQDRAHGGGTTLAPHPACAESARRWEAIGDNRTMNEVVGCPKSTIPSRLPFPMPRCGRREAALLAKGGGGAWGTLSSRHAATDRLAARMPAAHNQHIEVHRRHAVNPVAANRARTGTGTAGHPGWAHSRCQQPARQPGDAVRAGCRPWKSRREGGQPPGGRCHH